MAMDRPMYMDSRAIPNASPTENTVRISSDTLSETQLIILGISLRPTSMLTAMNTMMLTIITMRLLMSTDGSLLAMMGVIIDRMMTWPMSSMMSTRTRVSLWSLSSSFCDLRTARTTAVLDPDMIAPRQMHWTMSNPSSIPARMPPTIIIGSCMITMPIANMPCLRILRRLISNPMQNISITRPMSDRMSTISWLSVVMVHTFATMIPATMYPMSGGSLILLNKMEQAAASSVKTARLVSNAISSKNPPCPCYYFLRIYGSLWRHAGAARSKGRSKAFGSYEADEKRQSGSFVMNVVVHVLQDVPRLAVQGLADAVQGGEPDGGDLPGLDVGEVDVGYADPARQLVQGHLPVSHDAVESEYYSHMSPHRVSSDSF